MIGLRSSVLGGTAIERAANPSSGCLFDGGDGSKTELAAKKKQKLARCGNGERRERAEPEICSSKSQLALWLVVTETCDLGYKADSRRGQALI